MNVELVEVEEVRIPADDPAMTPATVHRRAVAGVSMIVTRGVITIFLGLGANVVLARLLLPRDFGLVALGVSVMGFANVLATAGMGAALIRRPKAPSRPELETLLALQLASTIALVGVTCAVASQFGEKGWVVATMVAMLPVSALRTPGFILLERDLLYRPLVAIDLLESIVYYTWAIATVASGWGVWGLATGVLIRPVAGTILIGLRVPGGVVMPRLTRRHVRSLLGFGMRVQATALTHTVRDQAINTGTLAIVGLSTLGLWSLANRMLQLLVMVLEALWRVSYPAMARLRDANEDAREIIERALPPLSIGIGVFLTALVGSSPALVPAVFGARWSGAADVLPWAGAAIMIVAPISVVSIGYLYTVGDASAVLWCEVLNGIAFCAVALPLLPSFGVSALGAGWLASSLVEAVVLGRRVAVRTQAQIIRSLWPAAAAAVLGGGAGWVLTSSSAPTLASAVEGGLLAEGLYLCSLLLVARRGITTTLGMLAQVTRSSFARAE